MDAKLFRKLGEIAYVNAGIVFREGKEELVEARVLKRRRVLGISSTRAYLDYLESDATGNELINFLDVVSTNFTSFFREPEHFEHLRMKMCEWVAAKQTDFRIWSAASSTGEEPYSIAMTLAKLFHESRFEYRILATDLSTRVVEHASEGVYTPHAMESVPANLQKRFFEPQDDGPHRSYRVRAWLKEHIVFSRLNLLEVPYPMHGPFDVIFCRNVMIYFDDKARQTVVHEMERLLRPGGLLFLGHAESLTGLATRFSMQTPSVFTK